MAGGGTTPVLLLLDLKNNPCGAHVLLELSHQGVDAVKPTFATEELDEGDLADLSVQVIVEVK